MPNKDFQTSTFEEFNEILEGLRTLIAQPDLVGSDLSPALKQLTELDQKIQALPFENLTSEQIEQLQTLNLKFKTTVNDCLAVKSDLESTLVSQQNKKKINQTYG